MARKIALVACVSKKRTSPQAAKDLYCSDWFIKASNYALHHSDRWFILSARYGLVQPSAVIEPYNGTLKIMPQLKRKHWAERVMIDLKKILEPGDEVIFLAGISYREHLIEPIQQLGCVVQVPMEGLGIGQQLSWLNQYQ